MGCLKGVVFLGYAGDLRVLPVLCPAAGRDREGWGSFSPEVVAREGGELLSSPALFQ